MHDVRNAWKTVGATAKPVPASSKLDGLDAYEQQLDSIQGNQYAAHAKYVTGNLNLWPRPLVIIANRARQNFVRLAESISRPDRGFDRRGAI